MAGAYASLVSLINTIDLIHNHSRHSFSFDKNQIDSLLNYAEFFLEFIESHINSHGGRSKEVDNLETRILYIARSAEDLLESHVSDQIVAGSTLDRSEDRVEKSSGFMQDFQTRMKAMKKKVMEVPEKLREKVDADYRERKRILSLSWSYESSPSYSIGLENILEARMHSIMEDVKKVKEERRIFKDQQPAIESMASASSTTLETGKTSMVGFDDYLLQLMDVLTRQQSARQVISVVGMGGLGKTTLARNVYQHLVISQHFDIRAWATVSQGYDMKEIFLELLSRKGESTRDTTADELGEQLHKKLSGRRYLIMLDDMWSTEAWDRMRVFFPDNGNGSRVVVTTRLLYVAGYFSSSSMAMELLDEDKSWELFCAKVFGEEEDCPIELEDIGKKIVEQCKGLPLSIVVIAGQLRKSSRSMKQWVKVAHNMISFLDSGEDQCLSILSSSYSHLPAYLKPCFLFMGTFPEDKEISVSTLIRFWVAYGFLRSNGPRMLEEIAEGYLKDLVERNLIFVEKKGRNGNFLICKVHDLVRELCLKVGEKENVFCVLNHPEGNSRCTMSWGICTRMVESNLLRILPNAKAELNEDEFNPDCLEAMFNHFNMRYISGHLDWQRSFKSFELDQQRTGSQIRSRLPYACLPSSINLLWNLQTLVIRGIFARIQAPPEIWEMPQLRHVDVSDLIRLPDPPPVDDDGDFVMRNLQTLMVVENFKLVEGVCRRIPNIKELEMHYNVLDQAEYYQHNLGRFNKLESLRCEFDEELNWRVFALKLAFPSSLQELTLGSLGICWKDMSMIGSLPRLEVLTLCYKNSVRGEEWNPVEGEFLRLKSLTIYNCDDLVCWNGERSHFPVLESVTLGYAHKLSEFPSDIGEIPTLGCVYLDRCSVSAAVSAMRMLVEQEELGNEDLRLEIQLEDEEELESVRKMVEEEGIESNNLRLKYYSF